MRRHRSVAAAFVWTALVLTWALFAAGDVYMCLGPTGVTEGSCRAANGIPPLTDWDRFRRGGGGIAILLVVGWTAIAVVGRWKRQRGGL